MNWADALLRASEVTRAIVVVNNTLTGEPLTTYQTERDSVEFYMYDANGERAHHFRFGTQGHEYVIHDVMAGADRWRGNAPQRALSTWTAHLLDYVNLY